MPSVHSSRLSLPCVRVLALVLVAALLNCPLARAASIEALEGSSIVISGDGSTVFHGDSSSFSARENGNTSPIPGEVTASSQDGSVVLRRSGVSWTVHTGSAAGGYSEQKAFSERMAGMSPDGKAFVGDDTSAPQQRGIMWLTEDYSNWERVSIVTSGSPCDVSNVNADGKRVTPILSYGTGQIYYIDESTHDVTPGALLEISSSKILRMAINANGTLVAGSRNDNASRRASIWKTSTGALTTLDHGTATESEVLGLNASGSVLVGYGMFDEIDQALFWTGSGTSYTVHDLKESLEDEGVDLDGWILTRATGVSDDGTIIVGTASQPDGSVVYLANVPKAGLTTAESLTRSVASMGPVGRAVSSMGSLSMSRLGGVAQGMGSRFAVSAPGTGSAGGNRASGDRSGLSGGDEMTGSLELWGIGSLGTNTEMDGGDFGLHGGIGLTWHTGGEWRFGGGVFGDMREMDTDQTGSQRVEAIGPGVFAVYSPEGTGLELGVSALWQSVDLRLTRGYVNGAGYATSTGNPDAEVLGLTGRAQWTTRGFDDSLALTPFAEYTWQSTHVDGYDESDGPFPASFDSRSDVSNSIRTGLRLDADLFENMGTWAWVAANHRFDSKSSAMGGTVTGLGRFNYDGADLDQEWFDMGLGASWQLTDRLSTNLTLGTAMGCDDDTVPDMTASMGFSYTLW